MILFMTLVIIGFSLAIAADSEPNEDQRVINETLTKYGPPRDYKILELPGPEIAVDEEKLSLSNRFDCNSNKTCIIRVRSVTSYFSYNGRYEETVVNVKDDQEILKTKGQFGEHFKRKSGGFYIRTIGYTLDENGYHQFLMDLTTAQTTVQEVSIDHFGGGVPGKPINKGAISSTVLGTLIGGNSVG